MKNEFEEFFKVFHKVGLPLLSQIIDYEDFGGDKLKKVMALFALFSSFNCGIMKDLAHANELIEKEVDLNFMKADSDQVSLVKVKEIQELPSFVREATEISTLQIKQNTYKARRLPFLSDKLGYSPKVQIKAVGWSLLSLGIGQVGIKWVEDLAKPPLASIFNGILCKKVGNASWVPPQVDSAFRATFTQVALQGNQTLMNQLGQQENPSLEQTLVSIGHHLSHVRKLLKNSVK